MNQALEIVASVGLLSLILLGVTLFDWPPIDAYLTYIQGAVNYLYFFNDFFPIDTLMNVGLVALTFEIIVLGYKLLTAIVSFVSGRTWAHQHKKTDDK